MATALSNAQAGEPAIPNTLTLLQRVTPPAHVCLAIYYALAATGTAASYFAAVTASLRNFPHRSGLAIGLSLGLFGLSPLLLSQIGGTFFTTSTGEIDAAAFLSFLSIFLFIINLVGAFGLGLPAIKPEASDASEETPLLASAPRAEQGVSRSLRAFLTGPSVYILAAIILLGTGPAEMVIASLGAMVESVVGSSKVGTVSSLKSRQHQVQILAVCNTVSRIAAGWIADAYCPHSPEIACDEGDEDEQKERRLSRLHIIAFVAVLFSLTLVVSALSMSSLMGVSFLSAITGLAFGTIFTLWYVGSSYL